MAENNTVPYWTELLSNLWELSGRQTFESIDLPKYCKENGYDKEEVACVLNVYSAWKYIEWGVSPMYPWFCKEYGEKDER